MEKICDIHPVANNRNRLTIVFLLSLFAIAAFAARPWTTADDINLGIPARNSVQVQVEKMAPGHLHLTFSNPDVKFEPVSAGKQDWTLITIDGETRRWETGKPAVPVISRAVLLPNTGNVQLKILTTKFTEYHNMDVLPQQPIARDGKDGLVAEPYAIDETAYLRNAWYPEAVAELGEPAILRDARFSFLAIQPVQVNPVTHTVRVYTSIELETVPSGGEGVNELYDTRAHPAPGFAQFYDDILGADELEEVNASALPGLMLVICRPDTQMTSILQPYIDWRNRSGRPTTLVTTTATDASVLQPIITNAYNAANPPLEMVMLVGDGGTSVSYQLPSYPTNLGGYSTYTDHIYTQIVGTDLIADTYVGRWPCSSSIELQLMVNRSLNYERNPNMVDTTWFRKGWGYAGTAYPFNRDAVWYSMAQMNDRGVPWSGMYYDEHGSGNADATTINARCNPGLLFWAHRPNWVGNINGSLVSGVTSNVNKCFLSIHVTCGSGNWYGDNSGTHKRLVLNGTPQAPAGAIASMATATSGTHSAPNCCILTGSYYALGAKNAMHPAEMFFEGKFQVSRNYTTVNENQFIHWNNPMGDISANLWTGVPRRMTANIPQQIGLGQNRLEFNVTRLGETVPMAGVLVTAMKTNTTGQTETYYRTMTDVNGRVVLPLTNITTGNLYVTVVGNQVGLNVLPIIDTVSVTSMPVDLAVSGFTVLDDTTNGRSGNNNGQINPGERIDLNIRLMNRGTTTTANNVSAVLTSLDPRVSVSNGTHTYGNLARGDSAYGNGMYRVQLLGGLRNNESIPLRLAVTATDSTQNRVLAVILPIRSIQLSYISSTLNPATINPGTGVDISVTVRNTGSLATGLTTATLFSLSPYVAVNTSDATFTGLPTGTNVSNPGNQQFHVTANVRTIPGTVVTLGIAFNANMIQDTVYFTMPVGTRSTRDPTGPDSYGYLAYDDTDTGYVMCPTFNWVNIDSTGAPTQAVRLPLTSTSSSSDDGDAMALRLPFTARYYGNSFDSITVCTNGWMSFGVARVIDFPSGSTTPESHFLLSPRVWRLPSNEGPPNMVCVAWHYLVMSSQPQGVYVYNDTTNGWYVITWNGTWGSSGGNRYQLIILNPVRWPTPTGDCMLKFQYRNYHTGTGTNEIGYATMGIQDSTCTRSLEYSSGGAFTPGSTSLTQADNINRAVMYTTAQRFITGNLSGTVRRASDNRPAVGVSVFVLNGGNSAVTDSNGNYTINEIQIGHYNVRASLFGYNPKLDTVTIRENQTSTLNFVMTSPGFRLSIRDTIVRPNDSLTVSLLDTGQTIAQPIIIHNTGNGPLAWNTQLMLGSFTDEADSLWSQIFSFNATQVTGDQIITGVEFDNVNFWLTGANNYNLPHHLYKLDRTGHLLRTFNCPDSMGSFGWRDIKWDGQYLYSSYSNFIDKIDTANGRVVQRYQVLVNPARAIAIDTAAGVLYYCDQASPIYKIRMSDGSSLGSIPNPSGGGVYGLAWYPVDQDQMPLYAFVRDSVNRAYGSRTYKINPTNGNSVSMVTVGLPGEKANGISITPYWNPMFWNMVTVLQTNNSSRVALFELSANTTWLSYTPQSDSLQAGGWDTVTVRISSRLMPVFRYRVGLRFNTNSSSGSVTIPIVMDVTHYDPTSVSQRNSVLPFVYSLEQNYPNPFNPATTISFTVPRTVPIKLTIHDELGREVTRLIANETVSAGRHSITFDGSRLASGVYFYRLEAGTFTSTKKMLLLK